MEPETTKNFIEREDFPDKIVSRKFEHPRQELLDKGVSLTTLIRDLVSVNFISGEKGWRLGASGDVEINDLTFDGVELTVSGAELNFVDGVTSNIQTQLDGKLASVIDGTPSTDHTANGPQTSTFNAGASVTIMDLVYLASDGEWALTDSDAESTSSGLLAVSLETKTDGNAMKVALPGSFVRDDTWNWTPGAQLYVSGTPGAITATAPSGTGDVVRVIGYAVTADVIWFQPLDYVVLV